MTRLIVSGLVVVLLAGCSGAGGGGGDEDYAEPTAFLAAEIKDRIAALPYQSGEVLYSSLKRLAYIGEPAIPDLLEGLRSEHARTRGSCAYVLGMIRDRRTMPQLRKALEDPLPAVRYEAAASLGNMGDKTGYRTLIEGLSDDDIANRYKSHEALRVLSGADFDYRHDDPPEERRKAVLRWERWLERIESDIR
jgi:hypothetical protein